MLPRVEMCDHYGIYSDCDRQRTTTAHLVLVRWDTAIQGYAGLVGNKKTSELGRFFFSFLVILLPNEEI